MLDKEFVPYQESLELKELGFDEPCLAYYLISEIERTGNIILHYCSRGKEILRNNDWRWVYENFPMFRKYLKSEHLYMYSTNSSKLMSSAPTFSQAFRWFREKGYVSYVEVLNNDKYDYMLISKNFTTPVNFNDGPFDSYEEAELACLRKLIEIIKQQKSNHDLMSGDIVGY